MEYYAQIIDANLNRISEGLRVIEEYCRFVSRHKSFTDQLSDMRKKVNQSEERIVDNLKIREIEADMRAKEVARPRDSLMDLLKANFKRAEEGLRVLEEYTSNALYMSLRYDLYELEKQILLTLTQKNICPGIYLISDNIDVLKKGLEWGVSLVQLRDKKASKSELFFKAKEFYPLAKKANIPFIVNDYLDIALAVDADGFHSGQDDLPVSVQRSLLGPHKIIGKTTHSLAQGLQAQSEGVDYVSVGPIWDTPSKPGRVGIGCDYLSLAASQLHIPYVAIGGISLDRLPEVLSYRPPLIGLIRAYKDIPQFIAEHKKFV